MEVRASGEEICPHGMDLCIVFIDIFFPFTFNLSTSVYGMNFKEENGNTGTLLVTSVLQKIQRTSQL